MTFATQPSRPDATDYALLCTLAAIWGGSFMLIKFALIDFPPLTMTVLRLAIGAAFLFTVSRAMGERLGAGATGLTVIVLIGFFGNALPFTLISWGEQEVDAGLTAILMGIMPMATLILAHFFSDNEKLTVRKLAGVMVGFAGLVVLTGPSVLRNIDGDGIRQLAILTAAISYGVGAILTKRLVHLPRRAAGAAILGAGMILTVPLAIAHDAPLSLDPGVVPVLAVLALAILPTAFAALLMFAVLERQGAGFFSQVNLLVPPFGVLWAAVVLGERPSPSALLAMAFILAGILIARGRAAPVSVKLENYPKPIEVKGS